MWIFAMFDLPVKEPEERQEYIRFRTALLREGFTMLQYSVYARYCAGEEISTRFRKSIKQALPPGGEVRVMAVTDHQFGKMDVFHGKRKASVESPPEQLVFL